MNDEFLEGLDLTDDIGTYLIENESREEVSDPDALQLDYLWAPYEKQKAKERLGWLYE